MNDRDYMTLNEVAHRLRCSAETARAMCISGRLKSLQVGNGVAKKRRVVRREWLEEYEQQVTPEIEQQRRSGDRSLRRFEKAPKSYV